MSVELKMGERLEAEHVHACVIFLKNIQPVPGVQVQ